ncbi:MAG: carboxypeptidase-like regulatory domain-containing protein [Gemmatimonadaceae bacterium]
MRLRTNLCLAVAFAISCATIASGQAEAPIVVHGIVLGTQKSPVIGAVVVVRSIPANFSDSASTDSSGRYSLTLTHTETALDISVRALGYGSQQRTLHPRIGGDPEIEADFNLTAVAQTLSEVAIKATRPILAHPEASRRPLPGARGALLDASSGVSGNVTGDINAALAMVDGVLPTAGGSGSRLSAFGVGADQNGSTLNGADAGGTTPRDGPRRAVSLSTYDPKIGRFSGVQISTVLPSGTDYRSRSLHATIDGPLLQWSTGGSGALSGKYQNQIVSGAMAGPIRPGKTLYSTAYQIDRSARDLTALDNASANVLNTLGLAQDSVDRLLSTAAAIGLPLSARRTPSSQITTDGSAMARIDFTPAAEPYITGEPVPQVYLLASGSLRSSVGSGVDVTSLRSRATHSTRRDGLLQFDYAPYLLGALNETKVTVSMRDDQSAPDLALPSASVLLDAPLPGSTGTGDGAVTAVQLGGTSSTQRTSSWQAEVSNDASWLTYDRAHTFDVYTEAEVSRLDQSASTNALGNFVFNSLADFAASQPSSFARQFSGVHSAGSTIRGAIALSDIFVAGQLAHARDYFESQFGDGVRLQYGLRVDMEGFGERPAYNAAIDSAFGVRNDRLPLMLAVSPMAGFTWTQGFYAVPVGGTGTSFGSRNTVSGGIRQYRATLSPDDVDNVARSTGLPSAVQQLVCVESAAPLANWRAYVESQSFIPSACTDGQVGSPLINTGSPAMLYGAGYTASSSWRSELNWTHMISTHVDGKLSATYALNSGGTEPYDLNLNATPRFTLNDEAGRPVFVTPASIASASGLLSTSESRRSEEFSHVIELRSGLRSWQQQATARLEYAFGRSNLAAAFSPKSPRFTGSLQGSYTHAIGRAQASGFSGTTDGDPRDVTWGPFPVPEHTFKVSFTGDLRGWFSISTFGQLYSGFSYTPMVVGDINGDGYSNDRAFIFDPGSTPDPALAAGMTNLLANAPPRARECLRSQLGTIAARGSCTGPWSASITAIAIMFDPYRFGFGNRGSVSLYINNPLGAVDRLLHDDAHLRGWGEPALPDARLLTVRGFDPASSTFQYNANPLFGGRSSVTRAPFRLTLDVTLDIGPNRETEAIDVEMRRAKDASGYTPPPPSEIERGLRNLSELYGNADFEVMESRADLIGLDSVQTASIARIVDRYSAAHDPIYANLATYLSTHAEAAHGTRARNYWHDAIAAAIRQNYETALAIRALLTPSQIAWLRSNSYNWVDYTPEWLRDELRKPLLPH